MPRRGPTGTNALLLLLLGAAACAGRASSASGNSTTETAAATSALAVDSALAVIAKQPLWPNFAPLTTPVAIFDGTSTWLFRHPRPPAGYVAMEGRSDVAIRAGRDSMITANTSALLGGVPTATVMLDPRLPPPAAAALAIHELFHVFQRARHPTWQANEADLFTYPLEDTVALALRREEWSALRAALGKTRVGSPACWSRDFVRVRALRFAALGGAAAAYERGTELNEGLAQYVERRALGIVPVLDTADLPAAQVRSRAYAVGAALATLLDRVSPTWQSVLEYTPDSIHSSLDALLADAVTDPRPLVYCSARVRARWYADAADEVRALRADRTRARTEYLARAGWRLVIEAADAPFFPQGFDPLNVARLSSTEILHTRFLKLQGPLGSMELLSRASLTEGKPASHPLFNGVVRVTVAGLPAAPTVRDSSGVLVVDAPGVVGRFRDARADTSGTDIRIGRR